MKISIPPEEKAKEIFNSMHEVLPKYAIFSARDCSIACVQHIKSFLDDKNFISEIEYLEEVMKAIKKI